ncbi:MAG: VWA domain-containing protein [Singulisphaera sp.]|nr:VWA domain-containing protein [Singulisphaera sp.]
MEFHVPAPASSDDLYELADETPPPASSPSTDPQARPEASNPEGPTIASSTGKDGKASFPSTDPQARPEASNPEGPTIAASTGKDDKDDNDGKEAKEGKTGSTDKVITAAARKARRRRRKQARDASSWGVSVVVHLAVLTVLGLATFSQKVQKAVANINSALVSSPGASDEVLHVLETPGAERSTEAAGSAGSPSGGDSGAGGGDGSLAGIGTGPPSATPHVAGVGKGLGQGDGPPGVKVVANVSGLSLLPSTGRLGVDLGGGGGIAGDVTFEAGEVGTALDQIAREILRHLSQHKLTVVWLFDESESMKDDQRAIKEKFDRITTELKLNVDPGRKQAAALNHAIVGFGQHLHYELKKPTADIDQIGQAIDRLKVDDSGAENTLHAIQQVVETYSPVIGKDRRLLIVLVTDESGDDGDFVEEAHQAVVSLKVPVYVIGRQALFGYGTAHLRYVDPVTKDVYWPSIHRGPESADVETLQWDGLHGRYDEQPSGFAPYELARLAKDTGGIYFLLPSEENMRVRQREKLYSIKTLKEYVPDYEGRMAYADRRARSEFRRTLHEIITATRSFPFRDHFPVIPDQMIPAANEAIAVAAERLDALLAIQKRLEAIQKLRDREPDKRWQAHYDLMLAQIVVYQVKALEYRACLQEMVKTVPRPSQMPTPDLIVGWDLQHSREPKAPKELTAKKYAEAEKLIKEVIARHPNTPWADLAQDELDRGFSVRRGEWTHNPKYDERAKLVPKY